MYAPYWSYALSLSSLKSFKTFSIDSLVGSINIEHQSLGISYGQHLSLQFEKIYVQSSQTI